jgi:hypothetical protein
MKLCLSTLAIVMLCALPVLAQNVLRVPEDYESIQAAADAAVNGDTIRVGTGIYCGAKIAKRLTILGEGQSTITACDGSSIGLDLNWNSSFTENASGTIIRRLSFSDIAQGINMYVVSGITITHNSFSNVTTGIGGTGTDYVTIEHNTITMQSGWCPIVSIAHKKGGTGSFWTVRHNNINVEVGSFFPGISLITGSDETVSHNGLTGTGILLGNARQTRAANNTVEFNHIEGGVNGVGIGIYGQDGAVVRGNQIFIPSNPAGDCRAVGIQVAESGFGLSSIHSMIMNNDTRGTAVGVIVLLDKSKGTGNSIGNVLRGNFGTFAINQPAYSCGTGEVNNRSISTLITCDETGDCNDIP